MNSNISIIRLLSFLMIITCHILQGLGLEAAFYFNIGVQIFFFISGYIYAKKNIEDYKQFYKNRLKKILFPLSILVITLIITEKIFFNKTYPIVQIISNIFGVGVFNGIIDIISNTWFVSYILICYLITPIIQNIFNKFQKSWLSFICISLFIFLIYYFKLININPFWIINYLVGYFYSTQEKKNGKSITIILILSTIIIFPLSILLRYNIFNLTNYLDFIPSSYIWDLGHVLLGSSLFIIIYKVLNKFKIKYNTLLKYSDKYNYYIYLTHQIFILFDYSLLNLTNNLVINIILIITFSTLSGIMLELITKNILKILDIIINYRKV